MGNADTVQQRGRFFGYKSSYMGLILIFLEHSLEGAFRGYVKHEESMRNSLTKHRDSGKPPSEWRRAFFLGSAMTPTRRSVLSLDYMRNRGRDREWIYPVRPHASEVLEKNQATVSTFLSQHGAAFSKSSGHLDGQEDAEPPASAPRFERKSVLWLVEVYLQYSRPLHRFLRRRLHDFETTDDAVQMIFARLCEQEMVPAVRDVESHLRRMAKDVTREISSQRRSESHVVHHSRCAGLVADDEPGQPVHEASLQEFDAAVRRLPSEYPLILLMRFLNGMSRQEIADVRGVSIYTVDRRLATAVSMLQEMQPKKRGRARVRPRPGD